MDAFLTVINLFPLLFPSFHIHREGISIAIDESQQEHAAREWKNGARQVEEMLANVGFNCQSVPPSCCGENKMLCASRNKKPQLYSRPQESLTQMVGKRQRCLRHKKLWFKNGWWKWKSSAALFERLNESWWTSHFAETLFCIFLFSPIH